MMKLRVVIKDVSPIVHEGLPATLRSVLIELTNAQAEKLLPLASHESIAFAFFEEPGERERG